MSTGADLIITFQGLPEKYNLTKKQSAEIYLEVLEDLDWDSEFWNDTSSEEERLDKAVKELFNK